MVRRQMSKPLVKGLGLVADLDWADAGFFDKVFVLVLNLKCLGLVLISTLFQSCGKTKFGPIFCHTTQVAPEGLKRPVNVVPTHSNEKKKAASITQTKTAAHVGRTMNEVSKEQTGALFALRGGEGSKGWCGGGERRRHTQTHTHAVF